MNNRIISVTKWKVNGSFQGFLCMWGDQVLAKIQTMDNKCTCLDEKFWGKKKENVRTCADDPPLASSLGWLLCCFLTFSLSERANWSLTSSPFLASSSFEASSLERANAIWSWSSSSPEDVGRASSSSESEINVHGYTSTIIGQSNCVSVAKLDVADWLFLLCPFVHSSLKRLKLADLHHREVSLNHQQREHWK